MKRLSLFLFAAAALMLGSCKQENAELNVVPMEDVFLSASVAETPESGSKVDFEYTDGMHMKWHGDESLHVYIRHSDGSYEQPEAGTVKAVPGSLSDDKYSLDFSGSVRARSSESDTFVFIYAELGTVNIKGTEKLVYNYDFTKQSIDGSDSGLESLRKCYPIIFESDGNGGYNVGKMACILKFTGSNLPANAKLTNLNLHATDAVFPKAVDVNTFQYQTSNKSTTLSFAIENAETAADGSVTIYLAAPLIAGEKNYEITAVCEKDGEFITKKSSRGITGTSALSVSKLYNLSRNEWTGSKNPATSVGGDTDSQIESIIGQWDKTGYLSNDIFGVLEMGKPENLEEAHNAAINNVQKAYQYNRGNNDPNIHPAAVKAAGKAGCPELTSHTMAANGPQYVDVSGSYSSAEDLTFNNIVLKEDTELYMTFIDSKAWNTNTIGYYCYPTADEDFYKTLGGYEKIHEFVTFPSTSQNASDPTLITKFDSKTTAQLLFPGYDSDRKLTGTMSKTFQAGTTVGIFGYTNGLDTSKDFALNSSCDGVHYTNIAWNRRNRFAPTGKYYWNQIAVLRVIMKGESTPSTSCLIFAMKDKYAVHSSGNACTWTNPIILVYASNPDAIDFSAGNRDSYWISTVDLNVVAD